MSRFYLLGVAQSPKQLKRDRWSIVRLVAEVKQNGLSTLNPASQPAVESWHALASQTLVFAANSPT